MTARERVDRDRRQRLLHRLRPVGTAIYQLNTTTGRSTTSPPRRQPNLDTDQHRRRRRHLGRRLLRRRPAVRLHRQLPAASRLLRHEPGPDRPVTATSGPRTSPTGICSSSTRTATSSSATFVPVPIGLTVWGVDNPNRSAAGHAGLLLVQPRPRARARRSWPRASTARTCRSPWSTATATSWPPAWAARPTSPRIDRELRRPDRRHVLRRDHRRPRRPVQPDGHPRRQLRHRAAQHAQPRPSR